MENSPLRALPIELRLNIYELAVGESTVVDLSENARNDGFCLAITCKETFTAVYPIIMSTSRFTSPFRLGRAIIPDEGLICDLWIAMEHLRRFVRGLNPQPARNLRHLRLLAIHEEASVLTNKWENWSRFLPFAALSCFTPEPRASYYDIIKEIKACTDADIRLEGWLAVLANNIELPKETTLLAVDDNNSQVMRKKGFQAISIDLRSTDTVNESIEDFKTKDRQRFLEEKEYGGTTMAKTAEAELQLRGTTLDAMKQHLRALVEHLRLEESCIGIGIIADLQL